jgi:hypothetical protein
VRLSAIPPANLVVTDGDELRHVRKALQFKVRFACNKGSSERDYTRARSFYEESLVLRREAGDRFALAQSLEDLAVLAGREQQAERAIRILGAGETFCETLGARSPVAVASEYVRTVAEGRAALGEAVFARAWAAGRALSLEDAIQFALEDTPSSGEGE